MPAGSGEAKTGPWAVMVYVVHSSEMTLVVCAEEAATQPLIAPVYAQVPSNPASQSLSGGGW